jgi:hypothetical protein
MKTPIYMLKDSCSSVVGSLIYVMMCTRLDISFVVEIVSKYQSNSGQIGKE